MTDQDLFPFKILPLQVVLLFIRITSIKFSKGDPEPYSTIKFSLLVPVFWHCNSI